MAPALICANPFMMDIATLTQLLQRTDMPVLPATLATQIGLHVGWAVLLGAAVAWAGARLSTRLRWPMVGLVVVLTLLPGPGLPAYWLGLAFQMPSLTSVLLCGVWLLRSWRASGLQLLHRSAGNSASPPGARTTLGLALQVAAVLLGWVLLADLLALWPVSLYAWGFGPAALAGVCGVLALGWLVWGSSPQTHLAAGLVALVVGLYVVTRLPTGNVWDALLDPWLWLALQASMLRRLWRSGRRNA